MVRSSVVDRYRSSSGQEQDLMSSGSNRTFNLGVEVVKSAGYKVIAREERSKTNPDEINAHSFKAWEPFADCERHQLVSQSLCVQKTCGKMSRE